MDRRRGRAAILGRFSARRTTATPSTVFYAVLQADISLNDTSDWENWGSCAPASAWTPIGSEERPFKGGFDGNSHTISGVYIQSTADCQGLFGVVNFVTTVKNLNLEQSYISGTEYVGGICGR